MEYEPIEHENVRKESEPILEVEHLYAGYGNNLVISDVSFEIKQRDVFVILGPNGAGKTTLLRSLLNLMPHEGTVTWHTKKISYLPPKEFLKRKNLPPLTLEEFFGFKTDNKEAIQRIFSQVGLDPDLLSRQFGALSTGQFQRMLIAWALVDDPDVLLFDEPTSGIDIGGEETIYTLLHKFWDERNLTIILVTHDLNIVWEHANHVLCLNKEQVCMGTPKAVLTPEKLKEMYGTGLKFYEHHHQHEVVRGTQTNHNVEGEEK